MKRISLCLCSVLMLGAVSSCDMKKTSDTGEVIIKIGFWPKSGSENMEIYDRYVEIMKERYPDVTIVPDEFEYIPATFYPTAASDQLPNLYRVPFTEIPNLVEAGYAADISEQFKEKGYEEAIKVSIRDIVKVDEKYYGIPYNAYVTGMIYNIELFKEAGLTDEKGRPIYPTNFEELRDTAIAIKEKTGQAGFAFPTIDRQGGWMFMSMAWSFGVDFMEKIDGKWQATFDSPEMVEVLEYIRDLKWKYDVLPENILMSRADLYQLFSTDRVAMMYAADDWVNGMVGAYNLDKNNVSNSPVPAGEGGACALMGGDIWVISNNSTQEQIDAVFNWLEIKGNGLDLEPIVIENKIKDLEKSYEKGYAITEEEFFIYKDERLIEENNRLKKPYVNVDKVLWNTSYSDEVILKPEEPVEAQQLYAILSNVIQEVLINKDADIPGLVKRANDTFQHEYLDKANN